jgi:hypothetical protein
MKKVAAEHPDVLGVVDVVRVGIVAVEPETVLVAFDVEHVRVTIAVGFVPNALFSHCPLIPLGTVFYSGPLNPLASCTKHLHFLKHLLITLLQAVAGNTLDKAMLGFGSGKP